MFFELSYGSTYASPRLNESLIVLNEPGSQVNDWRTGLDRVPGHDGQTEHVVAEGPHRWTRCP